MYRVKLILFIVVTTFITNKSYAITNAKEIAETDYPSVLRIIAPGAFGKCTAVTISPRHIITAKHCLETCNINEIDTAARNLIIGDTPYAAKNIHCYLSDEIPRQENAKIRNYTPEDIAIIELADNHPYPVSVIASKMPQEGELIHFVGHGAEEYIFQSFVGSGIKRLGENSIKYKDNGEVYIIGLHANFDFFEQEQRESELLQKLCHYSAPLKGDSGGPWFNTNEEVFCISSKITPYKSGRVKADCASLVDEKIQHYISTILNQ